MEKNVTHGVRIIFGNVEVVQLVSKCAFSVLVWLYQNH